MTTRTVYYKTKRGRYGTITVPEHDNEQDSIMYWNRFKRVPLLSKALERAELEEVAARWERIGEERWGA